MLPVAELKLLIARLDAGSLTSLVSSLLLAEAARLKLAPNAVVMSDDLNEADEGLDARIDDVPAATPDGSARNLPAGLVGFQLKAVKRKHPSALKLDQELSKPGPRTVLQTGGTYVLVWSQDLNPAQRQAADDALRAAAGRLVADPLVEVWDATALAALCLAYPAAAEANGLFDLGAAQSLPELLNSSTLMADKRPWQADAARDRHLLRIRKRAAEAMEPLIMQVVGDPGTGKTRLVAEALNTDELRDSVLYINGPDGLGPLLGHLIRLRSSRGIVFVDEVDEHDVANAKSRIGGLGGRWRLVTVTSRGRRRWQPEGPRDMVLEPLSADATMKLIVDHSGLDESDARRVAEVAAGFPELAFRLAEELRGNPGLDLVTLSRLGQPQEILKRALSDEETRRHLAPLALFTSVGFDEDLAYQVEALAAGFNLDGESMKLYADAELGRFVSRAGRFRLVSPRLVAVWLATDLIESTPQFGDIVFALPEPLRDAFVEQLDLFGPDVPHLPTALSRVLADERFRSPVSFDEAAGRILRASAAIVPTQVVETIAHLVRTASEDQLRSLPRRDLVWSLEVLLWWPDTWQLAIDALYRLAQYESEDFGNNASAEFAQFFSVLLSGTTVPFKDRAAWLRTALKASDADLALIASAAGQALKDHHMRSVTGFRGGGEPEDWRPESAEEWIDARRTGWDLLLECHRRSGVPGERQKIVENLSEAIRTAFRSALGHHVDRTIRAAEWSAAERAELATGVSRLLKFEDDLPADLRDTAAVLREWLRGDDLETRADTLFRTPAWELRSDDEQRFEPPAPIRELADLVLQKADPTATALSLGRDLAEQETRFQFLRAMAGAVGAEALGSAGAAVDPPDWTAVSAALSSADEQGAGDWATQFFVDDLRARAPDRLPGLLRFLDATPQRVDAALEVVDNGSASAHGLGSLLYGAAAAELDEDRVAKIVIAVARAGSHEEALGILDQWLERHERRSGSIIAVASELAQMAVRQGGGTMVEYYLSRLLDTGVVASNVLQELWKERLIHLGGLTRGLDMRLTDLALESDAAAVIETMLEMVRRQAAGEGTFGLYASGELALLSRAAGASSVDYVWGRISQLSKRELRWAMHHMNWKGDAPEPLVRRLLLSSRLEELRQEASSCFFNTLGTVTGSMASAMERQLLRARSWRDDLEGTSAEDWADELVQGWISTIEWEWRREEERDMRFD